MRHARLKPEYRDTWHHCYNRTVGTSEDRPFGEAEKEQFVRETMRRVRSEAEMKRHRLARAEPSAPDALPICCWRRGRIIPD